jgi:hypothetical protein
MKSTIRETIHSSIIAAFTIAAALIWKDVIVGAIEVFVPPSEALFYKFVSAVAATVLVIFGIYVLSKTEAEADYIIHEAEEFSQRVRSRKNKNLQHSADQKTNNDAVSKSGDPIH